LAIYQIKDLENLTGIKAHTIRIWEKRYGVITPKRTRTNIRYYEEDDLKKLYNVAVLARHGIRISKIAAMTDSDLIEQVAEVSEIEDLSKNQLDGLTLSMIDLNEYKFCKILDKNINQLGMYHTMVELIYPFLEKLNLLWVTGSINQIHEYFISNLIKNKICAAIDAIPDTKDESAKKFILYQHKNETQDLALLFMHYLIKERNFKVYNLGKDITIDDLCIAKKIIKPHCIYTIINERPDALSGQEYAQNISSCMEETVVGLSGLLAMQIDISNLANIKILSGINDTNNFINSF